MVAVHRSRPDIEAADPVASLLRYRRFLTAFTRALLTIAALADTILLMAAVVGRAGQGVATGRRVRRRVGRPGGDRGGDGNVTGRSPDGQLSLISPPAFIPTVAAYDR
jgi:hypothetical protein